MMSLGARGPFCLSNSSSKPRPHSLSKGVLSVHTSSQRLSEGKEGKEGKGEAQDTTTQAAVQGSGLAPTPTGMNAMVATTQELAPGVAVAGTVMVGSFWIADNLGHMLMAAQGLEAASKSPVSGVPVAILLGLLVNNTLTLPASLKPGLSACVTTALRAGIVCVGLKLSVFDVFELGAAGVPAVMACITTGLVFVTGFNRMMGLSPKFGSLVAAGSSICGVTAIVSLAPAIGASQREVALAVANVVAFGTIGMLTYPYLANNWFEHSEQIGMFLGLAIHDTSQVMGSALTYKQVFGDEMVLTVAAITKLTRNMFLAAVIPGLAWYHARDGGGGKGGFSWKKAVPSFVIGFVLAAAIRSLGDGMLASEDYTLAYGLWDEDQWKSLTSWISNTLGSKVLLGSAMAAVGLSTNISVLQGVGVKPFLVGMTGALMVGAMGFVTATILGRQIAEKRIAEREAEYVRANASTAQA